MLPHLRRIEREGKPDAAGVFFQASPVAFVGKGFTLKNPHSREQAPTAQQAGLAGRETYLLDRNKAVVVEHIPMDHLDLMRGFPAIRPDILTQVRPGKIGCWDFCDPGNKTREAIFCKIIRLKRGLR
jgi:hypothetical protein